MEPFNLSGIRLSNGVKNNLADLVINKTMKSKEVAQHFRISINRVHYFTYRRRHSSRNYDFAGRTRNIDEISDKVIRSQLVQEGAAAMSNLKQIIKEEGRNTYQRKHPNYVLVDKRKSLFISHRSINRYYQYYIRIYGNNFQD